MLNYFLEKINKIRRPEIVSDIPLFGPLVRRKNTSDEKVFWKIFVEKEYDLDFGIEPKLIIEGGANIGASTRWFAKKFPAAKIIAVEIEDSNFKILEKNAGFLPNVKLLKAGIWNKDTDLTIKDSGLGKWGFSASEAAPADKKRIPAITIGKILADSGWAGIDILKLDIEGSEKEVFESGYENWLGKTKVIIIELHEGLRPGAEKSFRSAIAGYDFTESQKGENIVLIKKGKGL